jgi:hypothetical protein
MCHPLSARLYFSSSLVVVATSAATFTPVSTAVLVAA